MDAGTMFADLTGRVEHLVEEAHGMEGEETWRETPATLGSFVTSRKHLGLGPLFPRQQEAMDTLLGTDPKMVFEEPSPQRVPLAWVTIKRSTNVAAVGWHGDSLYVEFRNGGVYRYDGVTVAEFEALAGGPSVGKALRVLTKGLTYLKIDGPADEITVTADVKGRMYQMAVLLWGKGSGKDFVCSVIVCYLVHVLLCLRDPQDYFSLAKGEPIDVINVAYNADQAKKVFFEKLKERIKGWRWLNENYNVFESGKRVGTHTIGKAKVEINDGEVIFPRKIRCFSRHSENESYEGYNVIAWVMDEASAFLSKLKRENADRIYQTLRTSAASRFQRRWVGFVISYPRHGDDFTMTMHAQATRQPELGIYADGPAATWEINENLGRAEFKLIREGHSVPIELANDYILDYEAALARYECKPPAARGAFFRFADRLHDAVRKGKAPAIEWEPSYVTRTIPGGDGGEIRRRFRTVKITKLRKLPKGTRVFFHGDPGLVNDSFALALGHGVPATIMLNVPAREVYDLEECERRGLDPDALIEWEQDVTRTVIDALIVWKPDPAQGMEVDLQNVEDTILQLKRIYGLGFKAKEPTGTFDHWNSAQAIQRMQARKMNVEDEAWSGPFQLGIFKHARTCFYNDLVTLPDTPSVTSRDPLNPGLLYELERIELIEDRKVDHPENGSKDLADAVVRVIQHVASAVKAGFAFATAFGHRDKYPGSAPIAPSTAKRVDPNRGPDAITEAEREAEADRRLTHPLGELVPAEGAVNGRRLAFGSIRQR